MTKLPRNVKPQKLITFLKSRGFVETGGKGSHVRLKHPSGKWTQVAVHPGPVPQGTLRAILKQAEIEMEDLIKKI